MLNHEQESAVVSTKDQAPIPNALDTASMQAHVSDAQTSHVVNAQSQAHNVQIAAETHAPIALLHVRFNMSVHASIVASDAQPKKHGDVTFLPCDLTNASLLYPDAQNDAQILQRSDDAHTHLSQYAQLLQAHTQKMHVLSS